MAGLLQPAQGHQLHQVADMHRPGGAIEADIGRHALLGEHPVQFLGRFGAGVKGAARHEGAEEFRLELRRGGHGMTRVPHASTGSA